MSDHTGIQWTDATWNPVTGCTKVSQGCKHCYAEREWKRLAAPREKANRYTGRAFTDVQCHEDLLELPLRWKKPRRIFVNSMSDLFHEDVPDHFIRKVIVTMECAPHHSFQVLTKRPERMRRLIAQWVGGGSPIPHVWLGVSVEDQATADERIPLLLQTPAAVRWVSAEPLLGPLRLDRPLIGSQAPREPVDTAKLWLEPQALRGVGQARLDWVVTGGESGPHARPCNVAWLRDIVRQCRAVAVPVYVKQLGSQTRERCCQNAPEIIGPLLSRQTREAGDEGVCVSYEADEQALPCNDSGVCCAMLIDRKGGDPAEWPDDLRVREWPR
jgi:protein gp37